MRLYEPILTPQDFQRRVVVGETTESIHIDFKKGAEKGKAQACAVDVAAFQNGWGGTLLYGVGERQRPDGMRVAADLPGVPFEETRRFVEQAISDWLRPALGVHCHAIAVPHEGEVRTVLAVNVAPDERLVAVRGEQRGAIYYPYRTNEGNAYMTPDDVVVRANTATRAGKIACERVAEHFGRPGELPVSIASGTFNVATNSPTGLHYVPLQAKIVHRDEYQFRLWLGADPHGAWEVVDLPYGVVKHAWVSSGRAALILDGKLVRYGKDSWYLRSD